MSDISEDRPRPTPRPRSAAAARPSPKPRVAGARREREDTDAGPQRTPRPTPASRAVREPVPATRPDGGGTARKRASAPAGTGVEAPAGRPRRRLSALVLTLVLLCALTAAGGGYLLWERLNPRFVDSSVLTATRAGVEALYAYDYRDSKGSIAKKLAVLTGDLRDQYKSDLSQGGIIDTYEQVSATTSYQVVDVGLQRINQAQDTATLVVFGQYVVKSVNSGNQPAPEGSECTVTPQGAQSCTQTVQVGVVDVGGTWKINELTLLTTS